MLKTDLSTAEINDRIQQFLENHATDYSQIEKSFILNNATWGRKSSLVTDILRQVYDELDMLDDKKNIYLGFIDIIEENFGKNIDAIEVGGGKIACLGTKMALRNPQATITVYDNNLLTTTSNIPNLNLKKELFTSNTNINNAKLSYGFMPCEATMLQIETSCRNGIDFITALCDGGSETYDISEDDYWENHIIYTAKKLVKKYNRGSLEIKYMTEYDNPYPIIYNRK